ncbi:histidine kinase dimerization/phosphoacceptor domain -containing protein [Spirochaeta africana]|uniref:histidine kinase n=1 Tax=Spirochaeta africana (strain ATCC 700263 / DSM 8902 / Z-7692) TaxID=889378 RepID=H9UL86_SPIAZ|nr:histidine kinase dimerization/phosphoacceptor domain -containing protein [Spirochaeta africana]AFG38279.1 PAS domain S-box [Spirochaeta africana DSM 8902]
MPRATRILLAIMVCCVQPMYTQHAAAENQPVQLRVGIYNNSPKVFLDADGNPAGFFIDLLEYAADREGWTLTYHPAPFAELLDRLADGEIDVLPDVAYAESRATQIVFSSVNVIDDWLQVFSTSESGLATAADLDGRRIAVLASSRQQEYMQHHFPRLYDIEYELQVYRDYAATQSSLLDGRVDALVASRFFHLSPERDPLVVPTSIFFAPSLNLYGFRPGIPEEIPTALDAHISSLQNTADSWYYQSLQRWIDRPEVVWPRTLLWLLGTFAGIAAILSLLIPLLRRRLASTAHDYIEIFNSTSDAILIHDEDTWEVLDMNAAARELFGLGSREAFKGIDAHSAVSEGFTAERGQQHLLHARRTGFHQFEWRIRRVDGQVSWAEISLKRVIINNQHRILALIHDISGRKSDETRVKRSLLEKEILLKELYHRTKNNMQIICGLLHLQASDFPDSRLQQAFHDAENRILAMAMVHEKLYASDDLTHINTDEYLSELVQHVRSSMESAQPVTLDLQIERIPVTVETAIPLGLVLNELLTNSLKHAFPGTHNRGRIHIQLQRDPEVPEQIRFEYSDNGIGVPDTDALEQSLSLGLYLIRSLITEQLNGRLRFISEQGLHCSADIIL